ncbi:peptidylprolyl isomerase [Candidatus Purcelliella pentastirinorum]|uniref:Peptidylprolyl isomerase n=1 Tax=Candidatus Purcelliella pentastirinorum TaxID=472834 RepID=A0AAX3N9H6_9ENTR|nr:peptidylprolyl isomerase [Candidatus Purcelliella pentastirinorum]WDI78659.1 peptidylprolyl isomerase [Candidatus Purcelliella pentastirinorum]WDR80314.1 peptidylprolyl isomerase [Candidatus Purcelliella pentastirinorum]
MLKKKIYFFIILIIFNCDYSYSFEYFIDKISLIVNNQIILESDIQNMMSIIKMQMKLLSNLVVNRDVLRKQSIKYLINNRLIFSLSKKYRFNITNKEVLDDISNIINKLNITFKKFKFYLFCYGIDYCVYFKYLKREILISKILDYEISKNVFIPYEELNLFKKDIFYKYIKNNVYFLRCFVIPLSENYDCKEFALKQTLSNEIFLKLKKGIKFRDIKKLYVDHLKLVKIIFFKNKTIRSLPVIFENFLINCRIGDVSYPIKSAVGFYIVNIKDLFNKVKKIIFKEFCIRHIFIPNYFVKNDYDMFLKLSLIKKRIEFDDISFDNAINIFSMDNKFLNDQNGYFGWFGTDHLNKIFKTVLSNLNVMQISKPLKSSMGWHLIQLLGIRTVNYLHVLEQIKFYDYLYKNKYFEIKELFLKKLNKLSYIKIYNENE